mgnify:CR=1 FL=1
MLDKIEDNKLKKFKESDKRKILIILLLLFLIIRGLYFSSSNASNRCMLSLSKKLKN